MGLKTGKHFKTKSQYHTYFFLNLVGFAGTIWMFFWMINSSEQELINIFSNQELSGSSGQKGAQAFEQFLVNKWGKEGLLAVPIVGIIGILYISYKEIFEYIRFLRKDKLFRQGLVDNMYDDYQPKGVIRTIKSFFARNRTPRGIKKKYPSAREMRERL
ncbi:MAG: hypothetical protein ACOC22_04495 [bacterium]